MRYVTLVCALLLFAVQANACDYAVQRICAVQAVQAYVAPVQVYAVPIVQQYAVQQIVQPAYVRQQAVIQKVQAVNAYATVQPVVVRRGFNPLRFLGGASVQKTKTVQRVR